MKIGKMEKANTRHFMVEEKGKKYRIEIVLTDDEYEVYLQGEDIGIKDLMFGLPKGQCGINTFMDVKDLVIANLISENYLEDYDDEYGF